MSESNQNSECPDLTTLRALLDGTLPDEQQTATQAHVDRCSTCETALRQLTAGGESWIGIAEKLKGSGEDDPKLTAALERLKADDGSGAESSEPENDPQRTLDFLQPADDPKLLGKLGQHEISEVVGWGGMGVVLKAYDPSLHRVVAVKVLASHLAHHAVARKRFIREAQAAAAVCHDNVVTIHAIDESGPQPKIVMQFVAGGSLQERIDQEAPLELKEILRIAMQTAAGLAAAHAQGVVHRDVKPANILLENGVQRVKLTDFGLARVMDDASLTLSGVIAGTPQYMAPEQAWGRDVDARADLFSLGAVMYAMCSGHSPFRARTTMAVLKRVCEDAPRPLRAINPDVPDWLVVIIEKLLAKNPDDRFQSATEVSALLAKWLAHVQQPNVVERPPLVGQVSNLPVPTIEQKRPAGQVENLPHDRLLALKEFQRRPSELRSRLELFTRLVPVVGFAAVIGVLLIFMFLPSPAEWTTPETLSFGILGSFAIVMGVLLVAALVRWFFGNDANEAAQAERVPPEGETTSDSLSPKVVVIAMVVTGVVLAFLSVSVIEGNPQNLASYLGFAAIQLLATFGLASAFRAAWNTSSWVTWLAVLVFLPFAMSGFGWMASYRDTSMVMQFVCGLQALSALAYEFSLLFVRPLFVSVSQPSTTERSAGRRRLAPVACGLLVVSVMALVWLVRTSENSHQVGIAKREAFTRAQQLQEVQSRAAHQQVATLAEPAGPERNVGVPVTRSDIPPALLGRWVVVSMEGAALNGPISSGVAPFGGPGTMPGMMGGGAGSFLASGSSPTTSMATRSSAAPLQWMEFRNANEISPEDGRARVFDGRESEFFTEIDLTETPPRISLKVLSEGENSWRIGIFRAERDRLIVCWTSNGQSVPTEFAGNAANTENTWDSQLLVLRREWNPPSDFDPAKTPPPRAVIPFTADEGKRLQEAWATASDVPVETTNSLGMKLRLMPAGAFDPLQQQMLDSVSYHAEGYVAGPAVPRPVYVATHEVTVAQFRKFVEATRYETSAERVSPTLEPGTWRTPGIVQDGDQHPVVQISWQDANAFCRWLSDSEQQSYRLPSLAEWAFVARAGLTVEARIKPATNARLKFFDTTAPVGGDTANLFGLHDLFGNVGEWTSHISALEESQHRISLGGGFRNAITSEMTSRNNLPIHHVSGWLMLRRGGDSAHFDDIGFRVVRDLAREGTISAETETRAKPEP